MIGKSLEENNSNIPPKKLFICDGLEMEKKQNEFELKVTGPKNI